MPLQAMLYCNMHAKPNRTILFLLMSYHLILCHLMPWHTKPCCATLSHNMLYRGMSCNTIACHTVPPDTMSCYAIAYPIIPYQQSRHTKPCYIIPHCARPDHVKPYLATRYAILCHNIIIKYIVLYCIYV